MIARDLISNEVSPLMTSDTGEEAVTIMSVFQVKHLPIVNNQQLLGLISEDDILSSNLQEPIGSYQLRLVRPFAKMTDHLFEVMGQMAKKNLTVIPVIDENENYLGLITQADLIQFYAKSYSFAEPGSIIVIETTKPNYSLAEISRIIEGESAAILSTFLTTDEVTNNVEVTIKVNKKELQYIVASLNRFGYTVRASFSEEEYRDSLKDNYDSLMSYLNV